MKPREKHKTGRGISKNLMIPHKMGVVSIRDANPETSPELEDEFLDKRDLLKMDMAPHIIDTL